LDQLTCQLIETRLITERAKRAVCLSGRGHR
jgi:hypothetical protein